MDHPLLYEVNARQWLASLSRKHRQKIQLGNVPAEEVVSLKKIGTTHLWLMGVWPTGPKSRAQALTHNDLRKAYDDALPGWSEDDVLGSPYAVQELEVASSIGGEPGLAVFRAQLASHGIKLILDFVPNHLGLDHEWVLRRPHLFVGADHPFPDAFPVETSAQKRYIAHGKDPYFPGWTDTAQLDYRSNQTRDAMTELILSLTQKCDGIRCDMAMLLISEVFENTWKHVPFEGNRSSTEFWHHSITRAKSIRPDFLFLAEAYWGLEGKLCELGFDYAYDKTLYDFVVHDHPQNIQPHLSGLGLQNAHRAHFLENHDEPRAAVELSHERHRAAAVLIMGLPGMRFLHDGQTEGFKRFARVQLARRADEPLDANIHSIYHPLLEIFAQSLVGRGEGTLLQTRQAWEGNPTSQFFTVVQWQAPNAKDEFNLVVVNMAPHRSQCRVTLTVPNLAGSQWKLEDRIGTETWIRDGDELATVGLFLDLPPRGAQLFSGAQITNP